MTVEQVISVSEYIIARLVQLNVKSIFGVPGDFNLEFLDYIEEHPDVEWVGNATELGAAYACDGYSRVSKSLSVLVTTFGVGELSALCGIAGMMGERLPCLHVVGQPSTAAQASGAIIHHSLGKGTYHEFEDMSARITAHVERIVDAATSADVIDRAIAIALEKSEPVYLSLPSDLVHAKVSSAGLLTPLPAPASSPPVLPADFKPDAATTHILDEIVKLYKKAKSPVVLVDACTARFGVESFISELVDATSMLFFETPMAKAMMDATHSRYGGCYNGANSLPAPRELVESSDLVFKIGSLPSDCNTGGYTSRIKPSSTIELLNDCTSVGSVTYPGCSFRLLLPLLVRRLSSLPKKQDMRSVAKADLGPPTAPAVALPLSNGQQGDIITQGYLWPKMASFFKERDVIIAETGTSSFGVLDIPFPKAAQSLTSMLWMSIGWSVGATLGAALATRDSLQDRRTILFVGDGSLQLTLQEIGTMMRHGLTPFLFVLNNDGYEVERQIHGVTAKYNDIQPYNHSLLLDFLSPPPKPGQEKTHRFHKVSTRAELDALLDDAEFQAGKTIQLIEIMMPRNDAPRALIDQVKLVKEKRQ